MYQGRWLWGLVCILGGCAVHQYEPLDGVPELPDFAYTVNKDVRYSPPDWPQKLYGDIYIPKGDGPFPAVLVVHGGGWSGGSRSNRTATSKALAKAGFVAVNISYRLAPKTRFPGQLYDLQQAMHWMHAHARQYNIDPARIGGFGYSAGAHLVSLLALLTPGDALDKPYGGPQTRLKAVVSGGTPADLAAFGKSGRLLRQFMGGTKQQYPGRYAAASPSDHVSPAAPAFFLYNGQWDTLVPISQSENFAAKLQAAGVHVELYRLRFRGHILTYLIDGAAVKQGVIFLRRELLGDQ